MLEFTSFTKVTYKQKMLVDNEVLQITICEENRQLGKAKIRLHETHATLEHIAIDEYSRFNGYGELLLNKVVQVLQKKFEHIKTLKVETNKNDSWVALLKLVSKHDASIHEIGTNKIKATITL